MDIQAGNELDDMTAVEWIHSLSKRFGCPDSNSFDRWLIDLRMCFVFDRA